MYFYFTSLQDLNYVHVVVIIISRRIGCDTLILKQLIAALVYSYIRTAHICAQATKNDLWFRIVRTFLPIVILTFRGPTCPSFQDKMTSSHPTHALHASTMQMFFSSAPSKQNSTTMNRPRLLDTFIQHTYFFRSY